jgi:hypothetical protein
VDKPGFSAGPITAIVLILICVLIGLATNGLGFWLLVVLAPVLILLAWPGRRPTPDGYLPAMTGCGVVAALLLVVVSFLITFVAVCAPIGATVFQEYEPAHPDPDTVLIRLAALALGLLAASFVAYLLVRRFWPRGGRP